MRKKDSSGRSRGREYLEMRRRNSLIHILVSFFIVAVMLTGCGTVTLPTDTASGGTAMVHVNVIPMDRERVLSDQTVIVREGRISRIGPASRTKVPAGSTVIDGAGKFLVPALADMHIHMKGQAWNMMFPPDKQFSSDELDFARFLYPYIANGVTTVQVMSALPEHIPLRDRINRGEVLGPRLILSRMIDGPEKAWPPPISTWVASAGEARQAVYEAKEAGYDKIKAYSFLSQETYDAIVSAAQELGMPVDGHIPMSLSVEYVLESGQNLIAHGEEVMKHAKGDYGQERIDYFADIIAQSDTWITPTLVTSRTIIALFDDPDSPFHQAEARYLHPMDKGIWAFMIGNLYVPIPQEHRVAIRNGFELFQQPLTKAMYDAGVKLMAGTDSLLPGIVGGFALHRELEELVAVGLSPYDALKTSTTHPFEFLGELEEAGTIEEGKRADLVLLEANPLEEITNSRTIAGVMVQGRWLSKSELEDGLDEIASLWEKLGK